MNKINGYLCRGKNMNIKNDSKLKYILLCICLGGFMLAVLVGCSQTATPTAEVTPVVNSNIVTAEGRLVPNTSTWLSFQTTGRVQAVLVKEGETIKKGQALVQLEGSDRAASELKAAQSALFLAQQNLTDAKNSDTQRSAAELALATAKRDYNSALSNYWDRNKAQGNDNQIGLYDAKVTLAQNEVDDLQDDLGRMSDFSDSDKAKAKILAALNQAKINLDSVKKTRDYYRDLPDDIDVETLKAKLDTAKSRVEDAQRDFDRTKDGATKESLAAIQATADAAQAKADDAQWAYDQLVLKAPYDGVFVQCDLTEGQFVTVGQQAALVADFSQWLVETDDMDENQTAEIDASQPVSLTADALPGQEFTGTVDRISQYYTDKNGDILYTAKIKLASSDPKLRWGMTMQVGFQK